MMSLVIAVSVFLAGNFEREFPDKISDLNIYSDVRNGIVSKEFQSYEVNLSFWSDNAQKRRWFKLPPKGKIQFETTGAWKCPSGTIFVKEFETETTARRIETRILYYGGPGKISGATYRWNATQDEALLTTNTLIASMNLSEPEDLRKWFYPGPQDCLTCHTRVNGGVLGLNTRQLNLELPDGQNQITKLTELGLIDGEVPEPSYLPRLTTLEDRSKPELDRVRSYLDVNCSICHQPGGVAGNFDARFDTPFKEQNLLNGPVLIDLNLDAARVVAPRDPYRSLLLSRLRSTDGLQMPPLGHLNLDWNAIELIQKWILSLPGEDVLAPPKITVEYQSEDHFQIEVSHPDPKAQLVYTTDGSMPTKASILFDGLIQVEAPVVIRARAYKVGAKKSIAVQQVISRK